MGSPRSQANPVIGGSVPTMAAKGGKQGRTVSNTRNTHQDFLRNNNMPAIIFLTHCSINGFSVNMYTCTTKGLRMNERSIIGDHKVQKRFK